ncbi:MAG: flagellar basal body rod protein FlgB [Candidatus Cloacimonadota bacterium]|nr:MAG: flagellar basal body rod protein FlgB [Candidatus Cloacimonadota bacterium]
MIKSMTSNQYLSMLTRSADHAAFRHNLLVNNLSNVNTPGYKRRDTANFEKELREALNKTGFHAKRANPKHIAFGRQDFENLTPRLIVQEQTSYRNDKSSVDVDIEMAEMAKNGLKYQMYTQKINGYFKGFKEILQAE